MRVEAYDSLYSYDPRRLPFHSFSSLRHAFLASGFSVQLYHALLKQF